MRHTDDIDDPTWHDLFDRDNLIKKLDKEKIDLKDMIQRVERENSLLLELLSSSYPELSSILKKYDDHTLSAMTKIMAIHLVKRKALNKEEL